MEYVKKRKWVILGVIMLYAISIALLYLQDDIKREIALMNIKEGDDVLICFEDEEYPIGYPEWFAQNGGGASPIPLVYLDKLSDEEEEIFLSYPEHYPHTEYFDGPDVAEGDAIKGHPLIGKWVGRGLLSQPYGWWMPYNKSSKCVVKASPKRVGAPSTIWLVGMFPLLYLFRKGGKI